jgi:MFS family permease
MMIVDPIAWAVMRMLAGFCVAGTYTIIESWLQAKATNETRGRTMGVYRVVDITGSLGAQLLIGVLEPAAYVSYNLLALLCCAALLPLTLTRVEQPETPPAPRLRPRLAWDRSPLAAAGVVVSGITGSAFRMVGPVYGVEVGLSIDKIAIFLAAFVLGGALSQYPVGWLADKFDRRWVLIWLSAAAILTSGITIALSGGGPAMVLLASALFGFATFPIYSVSAAHAHDFAESHERVELSAALMFLYAVGAIAAPYVASVLIEGYGAAAMFVFIAVAHVVLIGFGLYRMRQRPTEPNRTPYVTFPRTSFIIGRLMGRARDDKP